MVPNVIFRQAIELGRIRQLDAVYVLLHILGKGEGQQRGLVGELAQVGAGGIIFIYAGQAVVQERLAYIVGGRRVGRGHVHGCQRAVHALIERQGGGCLGHGLGQLPRLVPHRLVRVHAIQQRRQGARRAQGGDGVVISTQGVFQGFVAGNGQKGVNLLLLPGQAATDPVFQSSRVDISLCGRNFTPGM